MRNEHDRRPTAISRRLPPIIVEYDFRGQRTSRAFTDAKEAARFYAMKFKQGKSPAVRRVV